MNNLPTQSFRTRVSDDFRKTKRGIMFSSDVSARGMDYPDVTYVIQIGLTTRDQYVHRLGRTARAGKEGSGLLMCAPFESKGLKDELKDMPLVSVQPPQLSGPTSSDNEDDVMAQKIVAVQRTMKDDAEGAWAAWLGYYNSQTKKLGWTTSDLVQASLSFSLSLGLSEPPTLPARTLSKMGLNVSTNLTNVFC